MSFAHRAVVLFLLASVASAAALSEADGSANAANPIRRVVSMLQMMQKKIAAEGAEEEKQFERFMCYCKSGGGNLEKSISEAQTKVPQLESSIKETGSSILTMKADKKQHTADRDAAKSAMKEATALREKEAATFADYDAEANANLKAMAGAIAALEKGMGGAFIQSPASSLLQKVVASADLDESDREVVASFLSGGADYAPKSGQITGILKQMADTWAADLAKAKEEEAAAKANYEGLIQAKTKETYALQAMIEEKTQRIGEEQVAVVNMADDLEDTQKSLAEDTQFLADLEGNCATKKSEWSTRQKLRAEEQIALADTIKLLNDDDALELFKKTLPTPAFLQVKRSRQEVQSHAREALQGVKGDARLDLISLALRGKKVDFSKVVKMIDDMVALLAEEQKTDDDKKTYCAKEFDNADDDKKALERAISDLATTIENTKANLATLAEEIASLNQGIKDLDNQVAEATSARKQAHATFVEELASNKAANDLLGIAKNRLNKFYNPKLYKAAPKRVLSDEERITVSMGGELAATMPPGGISGTGLTALAQERPGPAPEMYGDYKKSEESTGVIGMIDLLKADLAKEMQESETEENEDQSEYEQMTKDSAGKRTADAKSLGEKEGATADAEAALVAAEQEHKNKNGEAMANGKYIHNLHQECDWLVSNFDVRKEARAGEVQSLQTAKSVLSGADFALLQVVSRH